MLRFVACVLIARQHDLCRTPAYRANVDYGRRAVRSPAAMSKMLANCEVVYIPVFWPGLMWRRLLTLKEASNARGNQVELPI